MFYKLLTTTTGNVVLKVAGTAIGVLIGTIIEKSIHKTIDDVILIHKLGTDNEEDDNTVIKIEEQNEKED